MITISYVKLFENGIHKGGVFCKKSNKFVYPDTWREVEKFLSMTEENAKTECDYLMKNGFDCSVCTVCIEDELGYCAYEI